MSVSGKLVLAIKMLLESGQYKAELNQAVSDTQAAAAKVEGSTKGIGDAVQSAVQGQSAVVRGAAGALVSMGAVAGTALVAAAAVGLAYHQAGKETQAYEKAIILTGNAAGVTSGQLADMARGIDSVAGTQASAAAALATMTASGQIARENLQKVSLTAVEMERATGQSIGETAKIFESLGDAPVKASLRLNESMNYLTAGTYAQIKAADDLGDKEAAASIAQNAAADAMRDRAAKMEQHLGTLERAWRGVRDFAKEAWDAMLNVGREQTSGEKLDTVRKRIAELENKIASNTGFGETAGGAATGRAGGTARMQAELQGLQVQAAALAGVAYQASEAAKSQADKARVERDGIAALDEVAKVNDKARTKQEQMNDALDKYRRNVEKVRAANEQNPNKELEASLDPAKIKAGEEAIRSQFAERAKASKAALSDAEKLANAGAALTASLLAQDSGLSGDFAKKWESLGAAYLAGKTSVEELTAAQAELLSQQPAIKKASEEEAKATLELAKARDKALVTQGKELEKAQAALSAQLEQNARIGLTKEAIADLDAAKLEMLATDLELQAIKQLDKNLDEQQYEALMKQAQAWRDLGRAKRDGAAKQAGVDSVREMEKESERAAESINRSLTDSLMRGFEAGKDAAKNMRDTVVNMFKTMVLRPTISAFMSPISGAINGVVQGGMNALGLGGTGASAIGTIGNLTSGAGILGRVGGWLGIGGTSSATAGLITGAGSTGLGLTAGGGLGLSAGGSGLGLTAGAGGTAASAGGISGALGAIPGWGWALAGVAVLGSLFSKKSTPHVGAGATYEGGQITGTGADAFRQSTYGIGAPHQWRADSQEFVSPIAAGVGAVLDGIANAFGKEDGYRVLTAYADDSSKDGAHGQLQISQGGKDLVNWEDLRTSKWAPRIFSDGEEGQKEYLAAIANDTRQVLLDMDLPSWADTLLNSIGEVADMDKLSAAVAQIAKVQTAFEQLGEVITGFANLTDDAFGAIMNASGGIENLTANASDYYENFYSPEEKKAAVQAKLDKQFAELGIKDAPKSREEYRKLVDDALAKADEQSKGRASIIAGITGLSSAGVGGLGGTSLASGIPAGLLGDGAADPANAGKVNAFMEDLDKLMGSGASAADIQAGVESLVDMNAAILGIDEDAAKMAAGLLALGGTFASVTLSTEDARKAREDEEAARKAAAREETDAAYAAMQRSIDARKDVLQAEIDLRNERIESARAVVELMRDNVRELRGNVASTAAMSALAGNAYIDSALSAMLKTGYLPDTSDGKMAEAVSAARGGLNTDGFRNRLDYEAAQLILANKLEVIGDVGAAQATTDELLLEQSKAQVDYLDRLLKDGKEALDIARGQIGATQDVETAVREFHAALVKEQTVAGSDAGGAGGASGDGFVVGGGSGGGASGGSGPGKRTADGGYFVETYLGPYGSRFDAAGAEQQSHLETLDGQWRDWSAAANGDIGEFYLTAKANGASMQDLAAVWGYNYADVLASAKANGVPAFALGGDHLGGVRLVGEEGPELEFTGPSRIYNARQTQQLLAGLQGGGASDSTEVVRSIEGLKTMLYEAMRALYQSSSDSEKLLRRFEGAGIKLRGETTT